MHRRLPFLLLLLSAWALTPAHAQTPYATLTGTVTDEAGEPLPGVHVFIATSQIGTTTDRQGQYRLEPVPLGAHRLYVSFIGFEPEARNVMLRESGVQRFDFQLQPAVVELGEITVEDKADPNWRRRLAEFTRLFIGETPNAEQTTIVNPEVLDFEKNLGHLRALASEPLVIENRALGYRVTYFLREFEATPNRTKYDGEPLFEELTPTDPEEAARWEANRRAAFMGSFRHFMLAVLADQVEGQGFLTYSRPAEGAGPMPRPSNRRFPVEGTTLLKDAENPQEYELDFHGFTEIVYRGEMEDEAFLTWGGQTGRRKPKYQSSFILLEDGATLVDYKGDVLDPYGVTFFGYWAFERVADEVPKEYRPRS